MYVQEFQDPVKTPQDMQLTWLSVQGALEWLEKNQDKSLDDIKVSETSKAEDDDEAATQAKIAELETGEAKSMVCNECGKKFKSLNAAEFHASKT